MWSNIDNQLRGPILFLLQNVEQGRSSVYVLHSYIILLT